MSSSPLHQRGPVEVIDLVSDDSDVDMPNADQGQPDQQPPVEDDAGSEGYETPPGSDTPESDLLGDELPVERMQPERAQRGFFVNIDGEEVFIPDEDVNEPFEVASAAGVADADAARDYEIAMALNEETAQGRKGADTAAMGGEAEANHDHEMALALDNQAVTVDDCLQRVLEIFPDISHEYVTNLYNDFGEEGDYETLPGQARLDNIIEQLVSATSYPKQEKGKQVLKRKREDSVDDSVMKKWEQEDRVPVPRYLKGSMQSMLKAEFPGIRVKDINETLADKEHLYQAFVALAKTKDSDDSNRMYGRGRPSTNLANADTIATNCGWPDLAEELNAARMRVQVIRAERAAEDAKKQAEQENLQKAIAAGETAECSACFDDLPMNRQIHCNGHVAHFTCFDCAQTYIKSEVGESRCRVLCTAGCGAGFATHQLNLLSDKQLLEKLAQLQQEKDIRDAGLDDLEECPFCDYKAILPPVEEDFEFRCANPECEKVSCRRCKAASHIPVSCEQHAKDNKINSRHKIEEAMTAALIRSCNKCKKQFIKEYGCNKMTCPSCSNLQCYVCSASLKDYNHFDQGPPRANGGAAPNSKLCPLYDNVEERHEREVKEAEAAARAQVVTDNPDVSPEDLEIKVSDAVKTATANRIRQAGGPGGGPIPFIPGVMPHRHGVPHMPMYGGMDGVNDNLEQLRGHNDAMRDHLEQLRGLHRHRAPGRQARVNFVALPPPAGPVPGGLQGYIPVFGLQPAAAPPAAQPPNNAPAQAPQGRYDAFGQPPRGFDNDFHNGLDRLDFGWFGAPVRNQAAPLDHAIAQPNNNVANPHPLLGAAPHGPHLAIPPPQLFADPQEYQAYLGERRDLRQRFQQLEMMRQQHDQHMLAREQRRRQNDQMRQAVQLQQNQLRQRREQAADQQRQAATRRDEHEQEVQFHQLALRGHQLNKQMRRMRQD